MHPFSNADLYQVANGWRPREHTQAFHSTTSFDIDIFLPVHDRSSWTALTREQLELLWKCRSDYVGLDPTARQIVLRVFEKMIDYLLSEADVSCVRTVVALPESLSVACSVTLQSELVWKYHPIHKRPRSGLTGITAPS